MSPLPQLCPVGQCFVAEGGADPATAKLLRPGVPQTPIPKPAFPGLESWCRKGPELLFSAPGFICLSFLLSTGQKRNPSRNTRQPQQFRLSGVCFGWKTLLFRMNGPRFPGHSADVGRQECSRPGRKLATGKVRVVSR